MGFALPAAIGAKLARPEAEVWVVAGDGGIQMNSQEFMTLVQEGLKINMAVLNNGNLGMVRQWQTHFYGDRRSGGGHGQPGLRAAGRGLRHAGHARRDPGARPRPPSPRPGPVRHLGASSSSWWIRKPASIP